MLVSRIRGSCTRICAQRRPKSDRDWKENRATRNLSNLPPWSSNKTGSPLPLSDPSRLINLVRPRAMMTRDKRGRLSAPASFSPGIPGSSVIMALEIARTGEFVDRDNAVEPRAIFRKKRKRKEGKGKKKGGTTLARFARGKDGPQGRLGFAPSVNEPRVRSPPPGIRHSIL